MLKGIPELALQEFFLDLGTARANRTAVMLHARGAAPLRERNGLRHDERHDAHDENGRPHGRCRRR